MNTFEYPIKSGIDIEEVKRIRSLYKKWGDIFLKRVFTDNEINYCLGKSSAMQHFTGRFAAKEAVIKILKNKYSPRLKSIEVINEKSGQPIIILHDDAQAIVEKSGIKSINISISHTRNFAVAMAIAQLNLEVR